MTPLSACGQHSQSASGFEKGNDRKAEPALATPDLDRSKRFANGITPATIVITFSPQGSFFIAENFNE